MNQSGQARAADGGRTLTILSFQVRGMQRKRKNNE
jgi:hypothetical protein